MEVPAVGFENMTYGECLYSPMVALIDYLVKNEFTVFISSGSERNLVRELTADLLEKSAAPFPWSPAVRETTRAGIIPMPRRTRYCWAATW